METSNPEYKFKQRWQLLLFNFFTIACLFFASGESLAAAHLCSGIFKASEATVSEIFAIQTKPEIKRTTRLNEQAEALRRSILESGEIDTTKLRSEFKHYVEASRTDEMIRQLENRFGPRFTIEGKQVSGIASRDGMVKLNTDHLRALPIMGEIVFGITVYDQISEAGLMPAIKNPLTYSQHRETLRSKLLKIVGHVRVDVLMKQVEELHIRAAIEAAQQGLNTYTDTASTGKFSYRNGGRNESLDEGVIRYRKYRTGKENQRFDGIPSPGSKSASKNRSIKDTWFADGVTWLEFKMKNTEGEAARATVVNKPRFPLRDDVIPVLKNSQVFKSENEFQKTKLELKNSIQQTVELLKSRGIKEASWNEKEIDAAIDFVRSLHLQGHSLEPVGRTVYMRKSYNLNLSDKDGKTHNIQITRDRHVWELGRRSGNLLQALPYVAKQQDWHFQYNSQTGMYEHLSKNKKTVLHTFHPRAPELVYEVKGAKRKLVDLKVEPVEVVEIKVPLKFIKLSEEDISSVPDLAAVASLRDQMKYATQFLNKRRKDVNLSAFSVDKGKRSSSRKDVAGGMLLEVNGKRVEFKFHPETGYWVAWESGGTLVYHPSIGIVSLQ